MQELKRGDISLEVGDLIPLGNVEIIGYEGFNVKVRHVDSGFESNLHFYNNLLDSRNYTVLRLSPEDVLLKEIADLEAERENLLVQKNSLFKKLSLMKGQTNGN